MRLDGCSMSIDALGYAVVQHDVRAGGSQPLGDRAAHGASGPGDHGNTAGQPAHR